MRKHIISLGIVALVVAGAVCFVIETPAHHAVPAARAPATPAAAPAPAPSPATAKPENPAVPRTVADGRAALAKLTPAERAELAPLAQAFEAAARAAAAHAAAPKGAEARGEADRRFPVGPRGIRHAVAASVPQLEACFVPWLALNPGAGGRVVATFHIGAPEAGADPAVARITAVKVAQGGLGNRFLDGCVLSVLSALRFEPPEDPQGLTVNYPLVFSPSKKKAP